MQCYARKVSPEDRRKLPAIFSYSAATLAHAFELKQERGGKKDGRGCWERLKPRKRHRKRDETWCSTTRIQVSGGKTDVNEELKTKTKVGVISKGKGKRLGNEEEMMELMNRRLSRLNVSSRPGMVVGI